ncbi:carbohydrate ABC transporter permease [Serinicoccus kebangsaanensis]|uniref:carbohydrate ABC transporter permease n=1 Tax=Serinicoccus kebangsaanensis TaxID=2602069 RepID=UPI00124DE12B|nr:sugar ABC transporter permease [Serinicoccus kebangsaanensis]
MSIAARDRLASVAFLLPTLGLFGVFVVYPIVFNVQASFLDWNGVTEGTTVGLSNYSTLWQDPIFRTTLRNSALWIPLTILPQAAIGFLLALALNGPLRGRSIYRALFFIPAVLSPVVIGIVWQRILDPSTGVLAQASRETGLGWLQTGVLADPQTAIFGVIAVNIWTWTGFSMLFYLAGLQLIDKNLLEAATIDGANPWQATWRITLPLLRNTHLSLLMLGVIGALKTFELIYVLTQAGPNNATQMLPTYAFEQAFRLQSVGYAGAISVVLVVLAVGTSLGMTRVFGSGFLSGADR